MGYALQIPGMICVDTRTLLTKTQKIEKKSLNDYLLANKIPLKLEVDFSAMNRAFESVVLCENNTTESEEHSMRILD
jgi:hypothetical protein